MLVLSRKPMQAIMIGGRDGIEPRMKVTVLEIKNGSVRLGFDIPAEIPVQRWEVWERVQNDVDPVEPSEVIGQREGL